MGNWFSSDTTNGTPAPQTILEFFERKSSYDGIAPHKCVIAFAKPDDMRNIDNLECFYKLISKRESFQVQTMVISRPKNAPLVPTEGAEKTLISLIKQIKKNLNITKTDTLVIDKLILEFSFPAIDIEKYQSIEGERQAARIKVSKQILKNELLNVCTEADIDILEVYAANPYDQVMISFAVEMTEEFANMRRLQASS